jgi:hypothetical protein
LSYQTLNVNYLTFICQVTNHELTNNEVNMAFNTKNLDWALFSSAGVILASVLTRKLMQGSYKKVKGKEPPDDPTSKHVSWDEALTWGIVSGAVIGLARVLAQEGTVKSYKKVFKKSPPR